MASELTYSASVSYTRGNFAALARSISALGITVSSDPLSFGVLSVLVTEVAIPLNGVTVGSSVAWFKNLDATNYIEIRTATGAVKFLRLSAGEAWPLRLGSGISAPYAIATGGTCLLEYVLFSA